MNSQKTLPKELTTMVNWSVTLLGEVIKDQAGDKTYLTIEALRKRTKETQDAAPEKVHAILNEMTKELYKLSPPLQHNVCHAFGMMLELINACEAAYRSFRLKSYASPDLSKSSVERITYVLTAHPTEAKTIELIESFERIQAVLVESLIEGRPQVEQKLKFWLTMAWKWPMAKHKKPAVSDEANAICTLALRPKVVDRWIQLHQTGVPIYLRTWVGGDKDGHPGVDEITMRASLNISRKHIVKYIESRCDESLKALSQIPKDYVTLSLATNIRGLKADLRKLRVLEKGDGARCQKWAEKLARVMKVYKQELGVECFYLKQMTSLLEITPALVIPLELREDSAVVAKALSSPSKYAIGRMLQNLQKISGKTPTDWYAKGFILSMCESSNDLLNGVELMKRIIKAQDLPVVPLFENEKALLKGPEIIKEFSTKSGIKKLVRSWGNSMEIMVGYSDSSKENGSLRSRQLIESALFKMEKAIEECHFEARFFHGSGGSVARGGGSLEEQTRWWPISAQRRFKATIQGEMIARSFASPEVFTRQASKIMAQSNIQPQNVPENIRVAVEALALKTRDHYRMMVNDNDFMKIVAESTPYNYLQLLKIGSRPSKRKKDLSLKSLRAIPWILCWTQTRVLFPSWWGLGSAWATSTLKEKKQLQEAYNKSPVFRSYINLMGFTLAKVSLGVWRTYLSRTELDKNVQESVYELVSREYKETVYCIKDLSGSNELLWHKPWLGASISLRNPLIHPLNALQLIALKNQDHTLLRETVTGIASGMMTTG